MIHAVVYLIPGVAAAILLFTCMARLTEAVLGSHSHNERRVSYGAVRQFIRNGDAILFESVTSPLDFDTLISWWTRSKYVHVGMAVWLSNEGNFSKRLFVLEAKNGMCVRLVPLSDYIMQGRRVHWFKVTDEHRELNTFRMCDFGMSELGENYIAYWRLVLDFLMLGRPSPRVRRYLFIRMRNWHARRKGIQKSFAASTWFCSELYAASLEKGGARLPKTPYDMSPADIAALPFLSNQGLIVP